MKDLTRSLDFISSNYKGEVLVQELFLFVKDDIKYKFGDWRVSPKKVLRLKHGMCTTKSRLLYNLLTERGFKVYFRILRINSRLVFGKFTLPEISKYLSENSVHFYIVVDLNGKLVELDCSLDSNLEKKLKSFGYIFDTNWSLPNDYINFVEIKNIISRSDLVDNLNYYLNKQVNIKNRFKFFISNICLEYIRTCDTKELNCGNIERKYFFRWLKKKSFIYYIFFLVLIWIKK